VYSSNASRYGETRERRFEMTSAQKWVTIVLSFILGLVVVTAGFIYGILNSPAMSGNFEVTGQMRIVGGEYGPECEYIDITSVKGEFGGKVLDIILFMLNEY